MVPEIAPILSDREDWLNPRQHLSERSRQQDANWATTSSLRLQLPGSALRLFDTRHFNGQDSFQGML